MGWFMDWWIKDVADKMIDDGKRIINQAIETRTYEHDTYNLHDSYGAAVFYKGKIIREYYPTPKADEPKLFNGSYIYGSNDIREYFRLEYVPETGLELACVSSMWYASDLEKGKSPLKRKYKVISQIYGDMRDMQTKYHANLIRIKNR